jgi:hypothetical protein
MCASQTIPRHHRLKRAPGRSTSWIRGAAEALPFSMCRFIIRSFGALLVAGIVLSGCDKLGHGSAPQLSAQRPSPEELQRIQYMSQAAGADGHKVFDRLEQAKSCHDLELAMKWNRPPDIESGPFNRKLIYLSAQVPPDLPKQAEVFITGTIERGESLPSGAWGWSLKMEDGSEVQAIEPAEYWQKQEQAQEDSSTGAIVKPNARGRKLCARGIYQGLIGKSPNQEGNVPLVSVLFALDRRK